MKSKERKGSRTLEQKNKKTYKTKGSQLSKHTFYERDSIEDVVQAI